MIEAIEQSSAEPIAADAAYREELQLPRAWFALAALPALAALVRQRRNHRHAGGNGVSVARVIVQTTLAAALLGYFATLRIVVQDGTLTVGFRRLTETIPLGRIAACEPTTYHWLAWGGYGIRMRPHARMYNLPSDRGRAVRLVLDDGREVLFSSTNPDAVCAAIRSGQPAVAV
jgi:Protein of unknown function (DUF3093)